MRFKQWLTCEMAWKLGDQSRNSYQFWKKAAKSDSKFIRVPWQEASKIMNEMGLSDHYHQKVRMAQGIPDEVENSRFTEWAAREFIKDHTNVVLAKIDPCEMMRLRSYEISKPNLEDKYYIKQFSQDEDVDPSLPLCIVNTNGVMLYDGNHRMASACELKQDAYAAIAYFLAIDPVKSAIIQIIESATN